MTVFDKHTLAMNIAMHCCDKEFRIIEMGAKNPSAFSALRAHLTVAHSAKGLGDQMK